MSNYSTVTAAILRETWAREDALPVMNENSRSRFFMHRKPTAKVCLLFHGFTATPEQFVPIGEAFYNEGYNVLIPLLPGHGIAGDWDSDRPPPLPEEPQTYQEFGLYWLQQAQAFGQQIIIGGLSGSGTLAAWLALERPQEIYKALVFAPYLSNSNKIVEFFIRVLDIYFQWRTAPGLAHYGYDGFLMPALRVFLDMGEEIFDLATQKVAAPMFIISSESDAAVGSDEHKDLFNAVVNYQPQSWYYCFDRLLNIPHNMMTVAEGNDYQDLLFAMAKAYVKTDLTWAELQKIREIMAQEQTFFEAVAQLNLSQQVSPDLATMMTVINVV